MSHCIEVSNRNNAAPNCLYSCSPNPCGGINPVAVIFQPPNCMVPSSAGTIAAPPPFLMSDSALKSASVSSVSVSWYIAAAPGASPKPRAAPRISSLDMEFFQLLANAVNNTHQALRGGFACGGVLRVGVDHALVQLALCDDSAALNWLPYPRWVFVPQCVVYFYVQICIHIKFVGDNAHNAA